MSMTESEVKRIADSSLDNAIASYKNVIEVAKKYNDPDYCSVLDKVTIALLEELKQYRAIGTVSEFRENKNFLEFLYNTITPNEMEQYLSMYHASERKGVEDAKEE